MDPIHIDDLKQGQTQVNERLPFHNKLTVSAVNERGTVLTGTEPHYSKCQNQPAAGPQC